MSEPFPVKVPALRFQQPLGEFCVVSLPAALLLDVCYTDPFRLQGFTGKGGYELSGSQRELRDQRLSEIARFIDTVDAAFPNSIILAANYDENGHLETSEDLKWTFEPDDRRDHPDLGWLRIPSSKKLAAVVDGQHRLFAFERSQVSSRKSMPLVCSVYLDLPHSFQAYIFATINYNQKPVDKSQTYELYAIDLETGGPESWTPEKTAVFLCRKLNTDPDSPFAGHIVVSALNDATLAEWVEKQRSTWAVSTACIVEGLLRLISANPKRDRDEMHRYPLGKGRHRSILKQVPWRDESPLRELFIEVNDLAIYTMTKNFFRAVERVMWKNDPRSFIQKTVGIQATFDVFRKLVPEALDKKTVREEFFQERLRPCSNLDFADAFFQASGTGRQRIRTSIELCLKLTTLEEVKHPEDRQHYQRLCDLK